MTWPASLDEPLREQLSTLLVEQKVVATPPRPVYPDQPVFITWRAVNRAFRFVPTKKNTEIIWYAFAYCVKKFNVRCHELLVMGNHGHLLASFPGANSPEFMELFNSLTARSLNAVLGINGSVIEKGYSVNALKDEERVLDICAYTLANPSKADLVVRSGQWKGVTTVGLAYGESVTIHKPKCGIWTRPKSESVSKSKSKRRRRADARRRGKQGRSKLPETVEFILTRPPAMEGVADEEVREEVKRRVVDKEQAAEAKRAREGRKVMGMKRASRQFWGAMPGKEDLFGKKPTVSASSHWDQREAEHRHRTFIAAYKVARQRWLDGEKDVVFPHGTWLLRRRFAVRCESPPQ